MDADKSRKEIYKADSKYWKEIVSGYVNVFHLKDMGMRNVMDMKAGYGGYFSFLRICTSISMYFIAVNHVNTVRLFDRT